MNVPREPILKSEKWRWIFSTLCTDGSELSTSMHYLQHGSVELELNPPFSKSWIRHCDFISDAMFKTCLHAHKSLSNETIIIVHVCWIRNTIVCMTESLASIVNSVPSLYTMIWGALRAYAAVDTAVPCKTGSHVCICLTLLRTIFCNL